MSGGDQKIVSTSAFAGINTVLRCESEQIKFGTLRRVVTVVQSPII